ncbi:PAS domain S-box-containing protein/diguanylate cyclase (GGDEF) domain-containing protein [Klenkia marina]|uniref:PAS domain S-box-containing protein/diguanylate cyclase (GGDEF) domain-containing protein n=1 Tax=Klenkia marina TaxID=1960309 RepID=A0A1G4XR31_9ACTN|nr:bifunctional diguanylate cyclase/phosphodiesterase [Klenkia marina]SCX43662.1 PAS domain S-box-containing protein/diguanylate cyclase (GGDEF) domain-containing protein [Klenkia marina]
MEHGTTGRRGTRGGPTLRGPLTVLGTLVVIGLEFVLLFGVHLRSSPVADQQVVVAEVAGALGAGADVDLAAAADRLAAAGADPAQVQDLRTADGDSARSRVAALATELADEDAALDVQAGLAYGGMLVLASAGWMVWFRRLVARHRRLQAEVTEQAAIAAGESRLAALVRRSADVVVVLGTDGRITYATDSAAGMFGVPVTALVGSGVHEHLRRADAEALVALLDARPEADAEVAFRLARAGGRAVHVEGVLTNLLDDPAVTGLVLTLRDVTGRVALEEQLTHQALHDPLTGLSNRRLFGDRLEHGLRRRGQRELTVVLCDLDGFADVNERFGHAVGDALLVEVAARLAEVAREGDTVARLGGDEFALLLEDTGPDGAREVAERIHARLAAPVVLAGRTVDVGAGIGLAAAGAAGATGEELLQHAGVAVHHAKDGGRGGTAVYDPTLHSAALERLQLRADLERAVGAGELVLHFQPSVVLGEDGGPAPVHGFEALVRWQHPTRGLLAPVHFVPLAEESGLVVPLGTWVLREACRAAVALHRPGRAPAVMSVNVAVAQLAAPGFVELVQAALADSGLAPHLLVLEITETAVLAGADVVAPLLARLRSTGIRIAVDDFGTGYSSLSYLRDLPVDVLKVDKSFVDRVVDDEQGASVARAIISLARSLGLETVAEGVEEPAQAAWLTAAGATYGQGYLWSRPVPLAEASALLEEPALAV